MRILFQPAHLEDPVDLEVSSIQRIALQLLTAKMHGRRMARANLLFTGNLLAVAAIAGTSRLFIAHFDAQQH